VTWCPLCATLPDREKDPPGHVGVRECRCQAMYVHGGPTAFFMWSFGTPGSPDVAALMDSDGEVSAMYGPGTDGDLPREDWGRELQEVLDVSDRSERALVMEVMES